MILSQFSRVYSIKTHFSELTLILFPYILRGRASDSIPYQKFLHVSCFLTL